MAEKTNSEKEREKIFGFFIKNSALRFSDIEKMSGLRSNYVSYHLDRMIKDELVEKCGDIYKLTSKAEKVIPFFAHITGKEIGVLPVGCTAIVKDERICLLKREKKPYKGYWGLIGGKLRNGESIIENSLREVKEETNLDCEFIRTNAVIHEILKEDGNPKHSFIIFLSTVKPKSDKIISSGEGKVKWFILRDLNKDEIIPSDYFMIKELLDRKSDLIQVVMEEKDEKLVSFRKF